MIFNAIRFAAEAHSGQYRKGTNIPYISHLTNVMKLLCEAGCDDKTISAGILHDVVEDTMVTLEEVETKFSSEVAFIVSGATEPARLDKSEGTAQNWMERKKHTIQFLNDEATPEQLMVSCADKLDNITAIQSDLDRHGDKLWGRFNAGKELQQWYYISLAGVFIQRAVHTGEPLFSLANKFQMTVKEVFGNDLTGSK